MLRSNVILKTTSCIIACGVAVYSIRYIWRSLNSKKKEKDFYDVLFFPDRKIACASHFTSLRGCSNTRCTFSHDAELSFAKLLKYVTSAHVSLDICLFIITCRDLADVIVMLYKRGVKVRIISDREQVSAMGSQIDRLQSEGIQVRFGQQSYLMHHKFAVVDRWLLINGSFNWTRQAIAGNNENVLVTDSTQITTSYAKEFERLWLEFNPRKAADSL